ncbi:MAG: TrkA family potassium uptake protein [Acidimicrobiia bacterium]|nr:TrkA family potassium uptake protein [Acidimicrobiia bacterium]
MRMVIVGGGKIGSFLAREMRRNRHAVVLIERDPQHARQVAENTGALVIEGDGTDVKILGEADVRRAGYLIAVTGRDEDNLVACQLARTAYGCRQVLARVNDPRNARTFEALDVPSVSVTDMLVRYLSEQMDVSELVRLAALGDGTANLVEVVVPPNRPQVAVIDLGMPESTIIAAIVRAGSVIIPRGNTVIEPKDRVVVVTLGDLETEVRDALVEPDDDRA